MKLVDEMTEKNGLFPDMKKAYEADIIRSAKLVEEICNTLEKDPESFSTSMIEVFKKVHSLFGHNTIPTYLLVMQVTGRSADIPTEVNGAIVLYSKCADKIYEYERKYLLDQIKNSPLDYDAVKQFFDLFEKKEND